MASSIIDTLTIQKAYFKSLFSQSFLFVPTV